MKTSTIPELRRIGRGWDWIATQIQDERNEAVRLLNAERNENEKLRAELRAVQGTDRGELLNERDSYRGKVWELSQALIELRQQQGKDVHSTHPTLLDILQCVPSSALKEDIGWTEIAAGECPEGEAPTVLRVVARFICKEIDKARPHVFDHFGDQPLRRCIRCDQREALASDQCPG